MEKRDPSQHLEQVQNSAVSNSGTANYYNIHGDQHIHHAASASPWKPPLMLPPAAQSFVGREEDLAWVLQYLMSEIGVIVALCGPGGMGKTALAAEALKRLTAQQDWSVRFPDGIFYHSFYAYSSLVVAFEELARTFGAEPGADPYLAARRAVSYHRAVLVFDGVERLDTVRPLRELGGRNVVLLLSRRRSDAPDQAHRRDLAVLSHRQAITLLEELAGPHATDQQCVERLVQHIGGYPLALQLIGSYLSSYQMTVAEYLQWFEEEHLTAIDFGTHQDESMRVLLRRTYDSLTETSQHLFLLLGILAPAPFPFGIVQDILDFPERGVQQALGFLVNLSILRRFDQGSEYEVSHPLIHTFAVEALSLGMNEISFPSTDTIAAWRERFLISLETYFEECDPYDRNALALWYPHILPWLFEYAVATEQELRVARLLNKVGLAAYTQGKYAQAELLQLRASEIQQQKLGASHPGTASSMNNLAELYRAQGKYAQAEPLLQQALAICEQQLGASHMNTAAILHNLALLYFVQGKYAEAEPLYQRALSIREQQLGASHPETAKSLNNLAQLYDTQGKYAEAELLYQRALTIYEQQLGASHPDTAMSLNNLAGLYDTQGKYAEAELLYQRALAIREQELGANHPYTAQSLNNLSELYYTQGKYVEAEPLLRRALTIDEQALGASHPDTAKSLNNLAVLYCDQGKYAEAEPLYKRALAICEQELGGSHPEMARNMSNLARLYHEQGKYAEAELLYQRALAIREQKLGASHPETAQSLNNLAGLYNTLGAYAKAEPLYQRALAIREQELGASHPETAQSLNNLAMLYVKQGKYAEAEPLYIRALAIFNQVLGNTHRTTLLTQTNYDWLLEVMGQGTEMTIHTQASTPNFYQQKVRRKKAKQRMAKQSRKNNRNR